MLSARPSHPVQCRYTSASASRCCVCACGSQPVTGTRACSSARRPGESGPPPIHSTSAVSDTTDRIRAHASGRRCGDGRPSPTTRARPPAVRCVGRRAGRAPRCRSRRWRPAGRADRGEPAPPRSASTLRPRSPAGRRSLRSSGRAARLARGSTAHREGVPLRRVDGRDAPADHHRAGDPGERGHQVDDVRLHPRRRGEAPPSRAAGCRCGDWSTASAISSTRLSMTSRGWDGVSGRTPYAIVTR